MSLISVLKSCQSTIGPGGTWRQCWPRGVWAGVLTSTLLIADHTALGVSGKSIPIFHRLAPSLAGFVLSGFAMKCKVFPSGRQSIGCKHLPGEVDVCRSAAHHLLSSETLVHHFSCVSGWGFPLLAPSHHPEGKSNHNLLIAQLCPFCGQWAFCVGVLSVILEPFILHYLCFG